MSEGDTPTILRPSASLAGRWAAVGLLATLLAVWGAVASGTSLLAWGLVAVAVLLTAPVAAQWLLPDRFVVALDDTAAEVQMPWQRVRIQWADVHRAQVVTVAGEPVLELHVWDPDTPAQTQPRGVGVLLPLGADLPALHQHLERLLGRIDAAATTDLAHPTPST